MRIKSESQFLFLFDIDKKLFFQTQSSFSNEVHPHPSVACEKLLDGGRRKIANITTLLHQSLCIGAIPSPGGNREGNFTTKLTEVLSLKLTQWRFADNCLRGYF